MLLSSAASAEAYRGAYEAVSADAQRLQLALLDLRAENHALRQQLRCKSERSGGSAAGRDLHVLWDAEHPALLQTAATTISGFSAAVSPIFGLGTSTSTSSSSSSTFTLSASSNASSSFPFPSSPSNVAEAYLREIAAQAAVIAALTEENAALTASTSTPTPGLPTPPRAAPAPLLPGNLGGKDDSSTGKGKGERAYEDREAEGWEEALARAEAEELRAELARLQEQLRFHLASQHRRTSVIAATTPADPHSARAYEARIAAALREAEYWREEARRKEGPAS